MNRAVYKYLLATYGRSVSLRVGMVGILAQMFIVRVYVAIVMAQIASNIAAGHLGNAKHLALVYLIVYIIGTLIGTIGDLLCHDGENRTYSQMAIRFHDKLINKDLSFYRDNQTGYLTSVFRQHVDSAMELLRFWRGEALGVVMSLTVPVIVLLVAAPKVGLAAAGVVIVQLLYIVWSSARANSYRKAAHEIYRRLTGEVSDEITNMVAFKSGGVEQVAQTTVRKLATEEAHLFWLRRRKATLYDFPRGVITAVGTTIAVYLVIDGASSHNPSSIGLIILTITYMFQIIRNVAVLPGLVLNHDDLVTKLYPTLQYQTDQYELIRDPVEPQELVVNRAAINFEHVSFSYASHSEKKARIPVFTDLNIHIAGGEQVGVVGLSGAGKSTLANLLLRFDDIEGGAITIDGIDIRNVRQTELRRKIAYVPQEPLLFHRSVRENIAYYDDTVSDAEVISAAKAAHAHEFITKLPDGYATTVGERGIKLSGGQKQRIAIARAVLKKAPIILFDEATSALDSESEQIIQRALPEIIGKQTAIVVAHRLSTIAGLDRIIVMHEGKIVEEGTHASLLKKKGRYYSLWQKQTRQ